MSSPPKSIEKVEKKDGAEDGPSQPAKAAKVEIPNSPDGLIDLDVFSQIRDMDEDDEDDDEEGADPHEFSRGIVYGYFEQAETTFKEMEEAIDLKELDRLSALGHFLKGSSAALGIIKVQASCEKMQHYGNRRDEEAGQNLQADEALKRIEVLLVDCKRDYEVAKGWMKRLYEEGVGL